MTDPDDGTPTVDFGGHRAVVRDGAVYFPDLATLVVADVHVGMDEASEVQFPLGERTDLTDRLGALVGSFRPDAVVFDGDVLHQFGRASVETDETLRGLTDACRDVGARPVLVRGNHDTMLSSVWPGTVHDAYTLGAGVVACHGHVAPKADDADVAVPADADLYVVGHDHPVITIEGRRRPCVLYGAGTFRGASVAMLPAFNRLAAGAEVNGMWARDFQSPFVTDADALRPIVWDPDADEPLAFPPLGEFRRML